MTNTDDTVSGISEADLEKMLVTAVMGIDPQHHIGGKVHDLLAKISIAPPLEFRVRSTAMFELGYGEIIFPHKAELGKELLKEAGKISDNPTYYDVLDNVVGFAYTQIVSEINNFSTRKETVPRLAYAFDLIQFAKEEGRIVDLNTFWYVPKRKSKMESVENSVQSPGKSAVRLDAFLKGKIIKDLQEGTSCYMEHEDSEVTDMLKKAMQIGVPIQGEDIANIGYAKLLQGSSADHALRLIKIAETLGAQVNPVFLTVATEYQKLKAQPQPAVREYWTIKTPL